MSFFEFESNIEEIEDRIAGISDCADFDKGGLGDDVQRIIAEGQMKRADHQVDPFGVPWDENTPATLRRKGNLPVGIDTGEMLSESNMFGRAEFEGGYFHVEYAGGAGAVAKLQWFEAGGRVAWGLDENIKAEIMGRAGQQIGDYIHSEGGH